MRKILVTLGFAVTAAVFSASAASAADAVTYSVMPVDDYSFQSAQLDRVMAMYRSDANIASVTLQDVEGDCADEQRHVFLVVGYRGSVTSSEQAMLDDRIQVAMAAPADDVQVAQNQPMRVASAN